MDFNQEYIDELREYDKPFENATEEQLQRGYEISKDVKDFDRPEQYLNQDDLIAFSSFCAYIAIVNSKEDLEEPYAFDREDLI